MSISNNVDGFYLSTQELLTAYNVKNRKELKQSYQLNIKRKSKRINGKVAKVYHAVSTVNNQPDTTTSHKVEDNSVSNSDLITFDNKLRTALGIIYTDDLVRVNLQEFGFSYDVIVGDYNLIIGYDRDYTVDELRPIVDKHKDYESNYGQNFTSDKVRFNSSGKLVSDLGNSYFYVARVNPSNEEVFIYRLLIELSNETDDREIYLDRVGYMDQSSKQKSNSGDYGSPKSKNDLPNLWECVEFNYNEYLYPSSIIGSSLAVSDLLFNDAMSKEQLALQSDRSMDGFIAIFGGTGKFTDQVQEESQAIERAVYKIYNTNNIHTLAQMIAENPTKLALVQSQIEKQGNQQWRDVNKLLKTIGLTAWVDLNGMVKIGVYGGTVKGKLDDGRNYVEKKFTWTDAYQQTNDLLLTSG